MRRFDRIASVTWSAAREPRRSIAAAATARERLERDLFYRLARRYSSTVLAESGPWRFHVATRDRVVGRHVFATGSMDRAAIARALGAAGVEVRGRTVLDVGANIGTTTVELVRTHEAARVIAVEPDPDNYKLLRLNLIENDALDRVTALNLAISDRAGVVRMLRSTSNWGDHRISDAGDVDVAATTLDALIDDGTVVLEDVALLWMDVQGHEGNVLAGASRLLAAGIPVVTEYWPAGLGAGRSRLEALIAEAYTTVIDLGFPHDGLPPRPLPASELSSLASRYEGEGRFTDLVLLP